MITVRTNKELLEHLRTHQIDGGTVEALLFEGGRLSYPGRKEIEYQLGYTEPYTLDFEARVIEGISPRLASVIRFLADHATAGASDPTLELLWQAHASWREGISLDRLVAALVCVEMARDDRAALFNDDVINAAEMLVRGLHSIGFPPTELGLEELFDGAPPACVGLGLVDL
jgi:hypothetical protein